MFAWQETPSPVTCAAYGMHPSPVCAATRPSRSTHATCRTWAISSSARSPSRTTCAGAPAAIRSSARGPYAGSATDCVATAPAAGAAQETMEPTENQCEWTAEPSSPVSGWRATIE